MEILLVHGLFGSLSNPELVNAFGEHRVHTPDLLGYGALRDIQPEGWTLRDQAVRLAEYLNEYASEAVHLVGHSVGGAVGALLLHEYPSLVRSYTSVEGNMTVKDAFWSAQVARQSIAEVESLMSGYRQDVAAWIEGAGVVPDARTIGIASAWLNNQPAITIRTQARAVVKATENPGYLKALRQCIERGVPVHLMAGSKSVAGWDVPDDIAGSCTTHTILPGRGHLMMLEDPEEFAAHILEVVGLSPSHGVS